MYALSQIEFEVTPPPHSYFLAALV